MDDDAHHSADPVDESHALTVLAYLLAGPLVYGGIGWVLDRWLGTLPWLFLLGILGGMAAACYLIWVRFGKPSSTPDATAPLAEPHREDGRHP